eukprot:TRINITY_DN4472_c0_g1_i1.p1 TRINITY_DN4472_c0_g1~~TRINITY_DN4472_c0_g1_i1.p1  ORF type:complete len:153 (+),score=30.49 TRINITY_DN4472_c0_g1_i1:68-526(+)
MPAFCSRFRVNASVETTASFHFAAPAWAFRVLTPPGIAVTFAEPPPTELRDGARVDFTLWFAWLFPVRWVAVHSKVSSTGFVDVMEEGPLAAWTHTHRFVPADGGCTVEDTVVYEYAPGRWWARLLFNNMALRSMFWFRAFATRRGVAKRRE